MLRIGVSRVSGAGNFGYEASLGSWVLAKGKAPFLEACRKLIAEGHSRDEPVQMYRISNGTVSFTGKLGTFADLSVQENEKNGPRFIPYRPFDLR